MTSLRMQREELALERIGVAMWDVREAMEFITSIRDETAGGDQETKGRLQRVLTSLDHADDNLVDAWNIMMLVITKERVKGHETRR
jgi:hypothetical protein